MRNRYYLQSVHAVRIIEEEERLVSCERYDRDKKCFVSDLRKLQLINDDIEIQKVKARAFWQYVASIRLFSLN